MKTYTYRVLTSDDTVVADIEARTDESAIDMMNEMRLPKNEQIDLFRLNGNRYDYISTTFISSADEGDEPTTAAADLKVGDVVEWLGAEKTRTVSAIAVHGTSGNMVLVRFDEQADCDEVYVYDKADRLSVVSHAATR